MRRNDLAHPSMKKLARLICFCRRVAAMASARGIQEVEHDISLNEISTRPVKRVSSDGVEVTLEWFISLEEMRFPEAFQACVTLSTYVSLGESYNGISVTCGVRDDMSLAWGIETECESDLPAEMKSAFSLWFNDDGREVTHDVDEAVANNVIAKILEVFVGLHRELSPTGTVH